MLPVRLATSLLCFALPSCIPIPIRQVPKNPPNHAACLRGASCFLLLARQTTQHPPACSPACTSYRGDPVQRGGQRNRKRHRTTQAAKEKFQNSITNAASSPVLLPARFASLLSSLGFFAHSRPPRILLSKGNSEQIRLIMPLRGAWPGGRFWKVLGMPGMPGMAFPSRLSDGDLTCRVLT